MTGGALSFLLSGGAGLDRRVKDFFFAAGLQIVEGYGMTECSPNLTMNRKDDYDFDSVGKPVPGVSLRLADDGEILVKGKNVFSGYYKNDEATRDTFTEDGWLKTGDLGSWTERGFLKIAGRKKEIIVTSGGKKIGPAGIEARFVGRPYIEHVVLYGDEHKYLTAMITLDPARIPDGTDRADVEASVRESVDAVNATLASFETIKKFFVHDGRLSVEAGHLTSSLKLRRKHVWAAFEDRFEAMYA
jgi:long-chain acyl-CoA synthetase